MNKQHTSVSSPPTTTRPAAEQLTTDPSDFFSRVQPPVTPGAASHPSLKHATANATQVVPTATIDQDANLKEESVGGYFLWDKAYDALGTEEHDLVTEYETLLSLVLMNGKPLTLPSA
jgi:hypothetical protein